MLIRSIGELADQVLAARAAGPGDEVLERLLARELGDRGGLVVVGDRAFRAARRPDGGWALTVETVLDPWDTLGDGVPAPRPVPAALSTQCVVDTREAIAAFQAQRAAGLV